VIKMTLGPSGYTWKLLRTDGAAATDSGSAACHGAGGEPPPDTTAPETTLESGPSGTVGSSAASFSFSTNEAGAVFQCRLDGAAWTGCSSPKAYTGVADGQHVFDVRARDGAGNIDPTPAGRTWSVDTTPPETTMTDGPPSSTSSRTVSFSFASSEPGSTFECRLDAGAWAACSSPEAYFDLSTGSHTFEVRAGDALGHVDPSPAAHTWTIVDGGPADTTPPDTAIVLGTSGTVASSTASFSFSSTEFGSAFECRLDAGPWAACSSPHAYSGLADGPHTFEVRATDAAGNTDPEPASQTWTVDTTAPETTVDSGPSGPTPSASAELSFSSPEPGAGFECRLDGGAWDACPSPRSYSNLAQGSHQFEARAVDSVGNADPTPAVRSWTVDTVAPGTAIDTGPSPLVASSFATLTFSSLEAGATFECALDGGAWTACASPRTYTGLADGPHSFAVRAVDAAGNVDQTPATRNWTVDTTAPQTTIVSGPPSETTSTVATFGFVSSESGSAFDCRLDNGAWSSCTSPKSYSGIGPGNHTFQVRARDPLGNTDPTPASRTWKRKR
jgi:large repetitive protein